MQNNKQFDLSGLLKLLNNSDKNEKQQLAENFRKNLSNKENIELNSILNDSQKIEAILKSAAAQRIIEKINGSNDGKHK